jgi:hypothetical protein
MSNFIMLATGGTLLIFFKLAAWKSDVAQVPQVHFFQGDKMSFWKIAQNVAQPNFCQN